MKRGKQTCRILKDIRRQITEANDIEFITSECQYQGDCLGTCPKCESEVRYLEQQLERKRMAGKAIALLGISAGLVALSPIVSCSSSPNKGTNQEITSDTADFQDIMLGEAPVSIEDTIPIKENDTLDIAEVMPEFPGGQKALMKFLAKKIAYPSLVQGGMVQGRVIIQFIVNKDGEIVSPKVVRSINPYMDKEALRVVNLMPKWKPGELADGTKVAVRYTVPVMFRLQ